MKVGGIANELVEVVSQRELIDLVRVCRETNKKYMIVGGGSNIIFSDGEYDGTVIVVKIEGIFEEEDEQFAYVTAQAGVMLDDLVAYTVEKGFAGLESLSLIPGTVGGATVQNAGAYGAEIADTLFTVTLYDIERDMVVVSNSDACVFGYRTSFFKTHTDSYIILGVTFKLRKNTKVSPTYKAIVDIVGVGEKSIQEIRDAVIRVRSSKLPDWKKIPTCGSFFMNPNIDEHTKELLEAKYSDIPIYGQSNIWKTSAGYLIEKVGYKGKSIGGASTYDKHALVIINTGNATFSDIDTLAREICLAVYRETGVRLHREVETKKLV